VRLAAPAILGQLLQTGVIYADRVMLGHFSGGALAAMQIAGPLEWTLVSVTSAFSVGTLALVGRAAGAGDDAAVRRHVRVGIAVALILGAVMSLLAFAVLPLLPALFPHASRAPGGAIDLSRQYFHAALLAAPFYCVGAAGFAAMSACGDTVTPMKIGVVVNVVHVAVNVALIGGRFGAPVLGALGAGISTALSYVLEAALTIAALSRAGRRATLRRGPGERLWPFADDAGRRALRALRHVSIPATLERGVYHAGYVAFVWMIALLGDDAMAANQALIAIEALSFMTVEGFATACAALVAQELGAQRPEGARRIGWRSTMLAAITLTTFGLAFFALRRQLPALVTPRGDLQDLAAAAIGVMAIAQPFMATGVVLGQGMRGAGATRVALVVSVLAGFGVRLVATWIATIVLHLGVPGVWMGSTADWIVRASLLIVLWRRGVWMKSAARIDAPTIDPLVTPPEPPVERAEVA
jgi:putative MATE family efflux protein